jgi:hypothetical protein
MSKYEQVIDHLTGKVELHNAYKKVFNNPAGEMVLNHLLKECGILNPKITTKTELLLIQQGQRHIVLSIVRILGKNEKEILKQIQESLEKEE